MGKDPLTQPQSNQRGIETIGEVAGQQYVITASIEPAWD